MHHFAASKHHGKLDLGAFFEELAGLFDLYQPIVLIGFGSQADFFLDNGVLLEFGFVLLFLLIVFPFAEIHKPTNGRVAVGRHFDQVHLRLAGPGEGLVDIDDTDLLIVLVDQADLGGTNSLVEPQVFDDYGPPPLLMPPVHMERLFGV